ncbi:MAG TPA: DUF6800 family protein [Anaerolineales bacterium]|nr:DUF6800 family protein [Anaerolineales bacterium]
MVERQREIRRRRRRVTKVRELKARLATTQDSKIRKRLMDKLQKLVPWEPVPGK